MCDCLCASFRTLAVLLAKRLAHRTHTHTRTSWCMIAEVSHNPCTPLRRHRQGEREGVSFSGRNCKLQCIFVLGPRWIYLVATLCKEGGVAFQQGKQEKGAVEEERGGWWSSLSRCIVFRKMPVWISTKSTFPLAETTLGWGLLVQLSNHILCKTSVVALCLISSLPNDTSAGMACL